MASSPIRVLIVDDHGLVRKGTRALLAEIEDIEVVGEAADGFIPVEMHGVLHDVTVVGDHVERHPVVGDA